MYQVPSHGEVDYKTVLLVQYKLDLLSPYFSRNHLKAPKTGPTTLRLRRRRYVYVKFS